MGASDDSLRLRVYRGLFGSAGLYRYALGANPSIHIIVRGDRVTLEGVVSSEDDRRFAASAARRVNGVRGLTNNLKIEGKNPARTALTLSLRRTSGFRG